MHEAVRVRVGKSSGKLPSQPAHLGVGERDAVL